MAIFAGFCTLFVLVTFTEGISLKAFGSCPTYDPVPSFNLTAYMGLWYEIERFPAPFEKGMYCGFAEYALESDEKGSYFDHNFVFNDFFNMYFFGS